MQKSTILIVDDESNNIKLLREILKDKYETRVALNGEEAIVRVLLQPMPELILLDIMLPDMDGFEVCKKLKANPQTAAIPVIFITAMTGMDDETHGFEVGAVDYIQKPVSGPITLARIATHIAMANQKRDCEKNVELKTRELFANQKAGIFMLAEAGHYNDTETGVHIWRMSSYSRALAQALDWPVAQAEMLELAAPMHDTGKIGIPDSILKAPRKLTDDEWVIMKQHTTIGYSILSQGHTPIYNMAADIALNHHEKWNGTGYPNGKIGEDIPLSARIIAIADVFDALTMSRPYKKSWSVDQAFDLIRKESGAHFDPTLVDRFLSIENEICQIKDEWKDDKINRK
ncbi:MAG: response regulator [Spirochaetia bacterium]|nr:response regulator [Spirochaetia bacterium]